MNCNEIKRLVSITRDIVLENSIEFDNIKNISSTRNESDHANFWNKICYKYSTTELSTIML